MWISALHLTKFTFLTLLRFLMVLYMYIHTCIHTYVCVSVSLWDITKMNLQCKFLPLIYNSVMLIVYYLTSYIISQIESFTYAMWQKDQKALQGLLSHYRQYNAKCQELFFSKAQSRLGGESHLNSCIWKMGLITNIFEELYKSCQDLTPSFLPCFLRLTFNVVSVKILNQALAVTSTL